jgi:VWFA-related protein
MSGRFRSPLAMVRVIGISFSLFLSAFAQQPSAPTASAQERPPIKIKTSEVLLDLVVNDKKGKPIRDLKAEEIEVYEDGVKQAVSQFRIVGSELTTGKKPDKKPQTAPPVAGATPPSASAESFSQPNLVTLLFDHLPVSRTLPVREAALYFVDNSVADNMLVRVMVVGQRLYLIEQFTNDRAKLRKAVERAVGTVEKSFAERSDALAAELTQQVETASKNPEQSAATPAQLARFSLDTLSASKKMSSESPGKYHIFSLLPFARAHQAVPGRKMALYFSEGLHMPSNMTDVTRAAIGEANRANLSFYAVNVRILLAGIGNQSSRLETSTVVNQTRRPESATFNSGNANSFINSDRYAGRSQITTNFSMFEAFDRNQELNKLGPLNELAEGTGGFQITQINDLNGALKRIGSELGHYYSLSYQPTKLEYDGKFRAITVKVLRPNTQAQTRSGYFALPPARTEAVAGIPVADTRPVLSYEAPLLAALDGAAVPRDFAFQTAALHFETRPDHSEAHHAILVEVPFAHLMRNPDAQKKVYPISFAVLALVKDEKGEIVQRFSEPHEMEIPVALGDELKKASYNLTRHFWLPPGRYTLEAAVHDEKNNHLSAQRRLFTVAAPKPGLQTGSLFLVKQVEQIDAQNNNDPDNPFTERDKRLIPELAESVAVKERSELAFHLAIFPNKQSTVKPKLKLELLQEGKPLAATTPELPAPDDKGAIQFTASLNAATFYAGKYQFHAIVSQGEETREETVDFAVSSDRKPATAVEEKTITSALDNSDNLGVLTLVALKESKPLEVSIKELLQEVESTGSRTLEQLGEYTYSLRKVRRVLTPKGKIKGEDFQDYEAYPVKGKHALIQLAENGNRLSLTRVDISRKSATDALIKSEQEKQGLNQEQQDSLNRKIGYWGASFEGAVQRRGQPRRNVFLTIDPEIFFRACDFSAPRSVLLEGRETIVLDFRPRPGLQLGEDKNWVRQLTGTLWIDAAERVLVRIEGQHASAPNETSDETSPVNFVYQQQRLAPNVWSPSLIRINAAGDDNLFQGLNWDAWFEFSNYKRFDARDTDIKLKAPDERAKGN